MKTQQAIATRILDLCKKRGLTVNGLATLAAIPPSTLYMV